MYTGNLLCRATHMVVYWKMNNMNIKENTTWKNKNSSGSVVVNKVVDDRKRFNGVRVYFNFDNGCGVQIEDSMLVTDFEQEYELLKQRYFYIAYTTYSKGGKIIKNNSFSITNGSHFNSIQFINNVKKHEKAVKVVIDNFIEFKTEQDFMDFKGGLNEVFK